MTDQSDGVWFRARPSRWGWGYHFGPVAWQGWVMTLGLAPVIAATVFAGDPSAMHTHNPVLFLKAKAMFGLSGAHLPSITIAALVLSEIAMFLALLLWKSQSLRPLD